MRFLPLFLLAAPLAAQESRHGDAAHVAEADGVRVVHAWTAATDGSEALVFMEVENEREAEVALLGGRSDAAAAVELVGFGFEDGEGAWTVLPSVPVAPGDHLDLAPNLLALRLSGLREPLREGDVLEVEVAFDDLALPVEVAVEPEGASAHSDAGTMH